MNTIFQTANLEKIGKYKLDQDFILRACHKQNEGNPNTRICRLSKDFPNLSGKRFTVFFSTKNILDFLIKVQEYYHDKMQDTNLSRIILKRNNISSMNELITNQQKLIDYWKQQDEYLELECIIDDRTNLTVIKQKDLNDKILEPLKYLRQSLIANPFKKGKYNFAENGFDHRSAVYLLEFRDDGKVIHLIEFHFTIHRTTTSKYISDFNSQLDTTFKATQSQIVSEFYSKSLRKLSSERNIPIKILVEELLDKGLSDFTSVRCPSCSAFFNSGDMIECSVCEDKFHCGYIKFMDSKQPSSIITYCYECLKREYDIDMKAPINFEKIIDRLQNFHNISKLINIIPYQ